MQGVSKSVQLTPLTDNVITETGDNIQRLIGLLRRYDARMLRDAVRVQPIRHFWCYHQTVKTEPGN